MQSQLQKSPISEEKSEPGEGMSLCSQSEKSANGEEEEVDYNFWVENILKDADDLDQTMSCGDVSLYDLSVDLNTGTKFILNKGTNNFAQNLTFPF